MIGRMVSWVILKALLAAWFAILGGLGLAAWRVFAPADPPGWPSIGLPHAGPPRPAIRAKPL